jgi:hypothetical protein
MSGELCVRESESLTTLAKCINEHHRQAEAAIRSGLEHALEAGRLLIEAKDQCQHGKWGSWLADNFEGSQRTARAYMQVAKRWPEIEAKRQRVADLSFRDAARMLAGPKSDKSDHERPKIPEGFTPTPGQFLLGSHTSLSINVFVAESIQHPGYWNMVIFDWRPQNYQDAATTVGFCRPIIADRIPFAFDIALKHEHMDAGMFDWHILDASENTRKFLDQETDSLRHAKSYWWRERARQSA